MRRYRTLILTPLLAAAALALPAAASAATITLNVNPVSSKDTNPGSSTLPLKTLTKALTLAHSGVTIRLAAGSYGPGTSGDQFPSGGLSVPSGVTITGATSNGKPASTLQGPGSGAALTLAGDPTVRNLSLAGNGFAAGVFATQGHQTLSNLSISTTTPGGFIGNTPAGGAISLFGTAQATLTNRTILLLGRATEGVSAGQQAHITISGSSITTGTQPNCVPTTGVELEQSAQATLNNMNSSGFQNLTTALLLCSPSPHSCAASRTPRLR